MSNEVQMLHGVKQGFFYLNTYFLLPEGYADESDFLDAAKAATKAMTVKAIILREDSDAGHDPYELGVCIAPYFITDYLKAPEEFVIPLPSEIYPAQVELLTQKEYNQRLRQRVTSYCQGCRGFGGVNENDSSLSGHFEEITLDGFCPYRWETRNSPRNFNNELYYFGSAWGRYNYAQYDADDLMSEIKIDLKLSYTSGATVDDQNGRTLLLYSKKPTLIQTVLTDILGKSISEDWEEKYNVRLNGRANIDEAAVMALLSEKKIAATRKELKKFGVKLAVLEYDPRGEKSVQLLLETFAEHRLVWLLDGEAGKAVCLLTGEHSLMRLRCAAPVLEKYNAILTVYDALKTVQYEVSYGMKATVMDEAPMENDKEKRMSKKLIKAEEGKVLSRDQVEQLFAYVAGRLEKAGCDHTLHFTKSWLRETLSPEAFEAAMKEIGEMGGYCDCEVLMNCYEDYELY